METTGAYTVFTLAQRCGVSPKTIRKNLQRVPGMFRVGRAIRFDRAACERRLLSGSLLTPDPAKGQAG